MTENTFTAGTLAQRAGVNPETIRYYERKGLLPPPRRSSGGFRLYTDAEVRRLHFIAMAKQHGFSLREIQGLLNLRVTPQTSCEDVRRIAADKVSFIDTRIRELRRMKKALHQLSANCIGTDSVDDCPILNAFDEV